jgi:hypothetical protein
VSSYDHAVTCPRCGRTHAHPLHATARRLHPIARCYGDERTGCRLHRGLPLELGLCAEGRELYERALEIGSRSERRPAEEREPWEERLSDALVRAKRREQDERDLLAMEASANRMGPLMDRVGEAFERMFGLLGPAPAESPKRLPPSPRAK